MWVDVGARPRMGWVGVLGFALVATAWAFPAAAGEDPSEYEEAFNVQTRLRHYDFDVVIVDSTVPARMLLEGEQGSFTLQLQSNAEEPIKGDFFVDVVAYRGASIPGENWKSKYEKVADVARLPIAVDLPAKGSWQNVVVAPETPAYFGSFGLVVDLGAHGRRLAGSYARVHTPMFKQAQFPQLCLDVEDPVALERLNGAPNRLGVQFIALDDPTLESERQRVYDRLEEYKAKNLPITVEFGAGRPHGPTLPFEKVRPWLDDEDVMLETKSDYTWLPKYDADFKDQVKDLVVRYGWPKGPVNAVKYMNEPWEGISIAGWGADMPRYREIYQAMVEAVEEARAEAGVDVLIGGCDSTSNTFDKLFGDGSDALLPYFDFCSIHYQFFTTAPLYRKWRDRESPRGRVQIWDTESWNANTDDRVPAVLATFLASGYDRAVGILHVNIFTNTDTRRYNENGELVWFRQQDAWSVAPAVGALNRLIGPRPFREFLFKGGLPWVMVFAGPADEAGVEQKDLGTMVVVGDIGETFEHANLLYRTAHGSAELKNKMAFAAEFEALARAASAPGEAGAKARGEFSAQLEKWNKRVPLSGGTLRVANPDGRFLLYDCYGNAMPAVDGFLTVPLDHRGFYLATDGSEGSFAALQEAVRNATTAGYEPLSKVALDFLAPIAQKPDLRLRLTNVLNRPVSGRLAVSVAGLTLDQPERDLTFAPHETKTIAIPVTGGAAVPDNSYPLTLRFEAGADGVALHYETLHVNYIQKRTVAVDGDLADWDGGIPQPVAAGGGGPTMTALAWEPYRKFETPVAKGFATGYLAYDDENFYFAARIADATPHPGTMRLEGRDDEQFYYPEVARELHRDRTTSARVEKWEDGFLAPRALRRPGGGADDRLHDYWVARARYWNVDFTAPEGQTRRLALFFADPDTMQRRFARLTFTDPATGARLDEREIKLFGNGIYAVYEFSGTVRLSLDSGHDWLKTGVGAIFLDEVPDAPEAAGAAVRFVRLDEKTGGDWEGVYGGVAHQLCGAAAREADDGSVIEVSEAADFTEHRWPEGVRRYSYRKSPVLPSGNAPSFDNVQLAFNVLPSAEKPAIDFLPGTMPGFSIPVDTDYEYALNPIAEAHGGGVEVVRLRYPGMPEKHYYPRQGRAPNDGPAVGAKLVNRRDGDVRFVECALPWSEIPGVKARLDAGEPLKFTFRVNDDGAENLCMELSRGRSAAKRSASFKADWVEHWSNEIEFGWDQ